MNLQLILDNTIQIVYANANVIVILNIAMDTPNITITKFIEKISMNIKLSIILNIKQEKQSVIKVEMFSMIRNLIFQDLVQ